MKDFNLVQQDDYDSDGTKVESTKTIVMQAELTEDKVIKIYDKVSGDLVGEEPMNFSPTEGTPTVAWNTVDEGIAFFRAQNNHLGE